MAHSQSEASITSPQEGSPTQKKSQQNLVPDDMYIGYIGLIYRKLKIWIYRTPF